MVDLSEYIAHLEKLKTRNAKALTEDELREIVRELGWTEADLVHLDEVIQTHMQKGGNFLQRKLIDEAIAEFQEAHLLAPHRPVVMLRLAQSHAFRWQHSKDSSSRKIAEDLARQVIEVLPNDKDAYDVLAAVRIRPLQNSARLMIAVVVAIFVLFGAGVVGFFMTSSSQPVEYYPDSSGHQPVSKTPLNPPVNTAEIPAQPDEDVVVPAELSVRGDHALRLETRRSINKNYDDSAFFEYGWVLHNESDHEFKSLKGSLELLDANGNAVVTESLEVLGTHEALLRRGDAHAFNSILRSKHSVVSARLNLTTMDSRPVPKTYPKPAVVPLTWDVPKPSTAELILKERESKADPGSGSFRFFKGTWELLNSGDHPFDALKLEIDFLDPSGKVFDSHQKYITVRSGADFRAGETRTFTTTHSLKGDFASYRIRVVEIL